MKQMDKRNITNKSFEFEKIVARIFKYCGYIQINQNYSVQNYSVFDDVDIRAEYNGKKYAIEVKYSLTREANISMIRKAMERLGNTIGFNEEAILVVANIVDDSSKINSNIQVVDIRNLLYMVNDNEELYNALLGLIEFSIEGLDKKQPTIPLLPNNKKKIIDSREKEFQDKLKKVTAGKKHALEYEKLCVEILKYLFLPNLSGFDEQKKSNNDLYRFDLICKIKNDVIDDFFDTIKTYFNTKYILFEFKNYKEKITQKEIYTTEKYLYSKALRNVAVIISRHGTDENAGWAIKGSLREQGKLIISLKDKDLLEMIALKEDNRNPSEHLSDILDSLLIDLEK